MSTANGVLKIIVFFTQYDIIIMQALAGTLAKSIPKGEKTHVIQPFYRKNFDFSSFRFHRAFADGTLCSVSIE